jgi:phage tail-like protein
MALAEFDKLAAHSYGLEVDGIQIAQISEVSGLKMEQDVITVKQNVAADGKYIIKKIPGRVQAGEVTFTRGLTDNNAFEAWVKNSRLGKMGDARKNAVVVIYDFEGNAMKRYKLINCWAKSLEIGTLKAGDTAMLTEKLVVTYEEIEPE